MSLCPFIENKAFCGGREANRSMCMSFRTVCLHGSLLSKELSIYKTLKNVMRDSLKELWIVLAHAP